MRCGEHLVHWWVKGHRPETTFSWDLTGEGSGSLELNPLETKESEHEIRKKEICIEFWLNLYTLNDMIEKLCPGLALCSVYNHLFLLCSSKIIFPIRAAVSIKYLHVIKVTQGNRRVSVMWNFCSSLPQGSVQFSSVQSLSRVWLCNPMNHSTPGLPVHQQIPEFTQPHIHWVSDAIQPSHPLS